MKYQEIIAIPFTYLSEDWVWSSGVDYFIVLFNSLNKPFDIKLSEEVTAADIGQLNGGN